MPTQKIIAFVGGLVLLGGLIYGVSYFMDTQAVAPTEINYVITSVQDGTYAGEMPDLEYVPELSETFPESEKKLLANKIKDTTEHLEQYPYDGNAWMELALHYRVAGDYQAAERVWLFIVDTTPGNVTALGNLGRQYHFELKQFEKAEGYFKQAIEANPDRKEAYFDLFDLYRYSYKKDTTAAVDILKEGSIRFPDDINFPASLGTYYRDNGRPNQARVQFEAALTMARQMEDVNLIQSFSQELSRL